MSGAFARRGPAATASALKRGEFLLVEVDRFQGPLDLLLHLIRTQDIDVFDIPISRITDQFLQAIQGIDADDLDRAGEFLEMAATLIRIKAQMLLPRPGDDEEEDPRAELVRRLLEYEQIREISSAPGRRRGGAGATVRKGVRGAEAPGTHGGDPPGDAMGRGLRGRARGGDAGSARREPQGHDRHGDHGGEGRADPRHAGAVYASSSASSSTLPGAARTGS